MTKDDRQLRTTNNVGLLGYRANYHGDRVIAIMKGNEEKPWQCLGIIRPEELSEMVNSGPCINLDELYKQ